MRRVTAPGASFVCSVENTMWPVSEALIAISAVEVANFANHDDVRRLAASRGSLEAKAMPTSWRTGTWLMPLSWYSTGSSTVMIFRSGLLMKCRQP